MVCNQGATTHFFMMRVIQYCKATFFKKIELKICFITDTNNTGPWFYSLKTYCDCLNLTEMTVCRLVDLLISISKTLEMPYMPGKLVNWRNQTANFILSKSTFYDFVHQMQNVRMATCSRLYRVNFQLHLEAK